MSKHPKLVSVKVKGGNIGRALSQFKRKVKASEHLFELKRRKQYLKPSVKKRLIMEEAKRKNSFQVQRDKEES